LVNDVVREVRSEGGAAMIVLHDRHSAGDVLDRVVRLKQGVVDEDVMLRGDEVAPMPPMEPMVGGRLT
jgi:ABC-type polar amino acid transport system ATPase subunit